MMGIFLPVVAQTTPATSNSGLDPKLMGGALAVVALIAFFVWLGWKKKPASSSSKRYPDAAPTSQTKVGLRTDPPLGSVQPAVLSETAAAVAKDGLLTERLLNKLEWHRLEMLISRYFAPLGLTAQRKRVSTHGVVDIDLFEKGSEVIARRVRCKGWQSENLGEDEVREFAADLEASGLEHGQYIITREFTKEARALGDPKKLELISGSELVKRINAVEHDARVALLEAVTAGDYTTPTCPKCDVKMVLRTEGEQTLWGCRNLPLCTATLPLRAGKD